MLRSLVYASLIALMAAAGPALSQSDAGVLMGTVVNAGTKQPLPDVIVTATSPALQGEQSVVTDSQGAYRIPQLPGGIYTLRMQIDRYMPFERKEIRLQKGRTLRINVELLPEQMTE
ncbi:MAG: hypothetical protein AMXMBFR59_11050 [Rhodanobacteraceae bacterium]